MRYQSFVGFLLLALATLTPSVVFAGDPPRLMIVLDASGSMSGRIGGKAKIQIAREVIADLLHNWDTNIQVGLTAYGHRRKGDCDDIEVLIQVGEAGPEDIISTINSINPKGMTPLSEAVRRTAKELGYTDERASVVLISDGVETCKADPCEVGAELAMGGYDFTAHVISFDVKEEDQIGLRCLAENTGGLFLSANDANELKQALSQTVEKTKEAPVEIVDDPGEASLQAPSQIPAGSIFEVKWEGPNSRNDYVTIVKKDAPDRAYRNYSYTQRGSPVHLTASDEPGMYEVRYIFGHTKAVLARLDIEVTPVEARVSPPPEVAAGKLFEVPWEGPGNNRDYITIVSEGAADKNFMSYAYASQGNPASIQAPAEPGSYEVRYITGQSGSVLAKAPITITAVGATITALDAVPAGSEFKIEWTGPNNSRDYITIVVAGANERAYLSYAYTSRGSPSTLRAPDNPGAYEVRYFFAPSGSVLASAEITISLVTATLDVPAAATAGTTVKIGWTGPDNHRDYIAIAKTGSNDRQYTAYIPTAMGNPASIKAPKEPGQYEARYVTGQSGSILARTTIIVK